MDWGDFLQNTAQDLIGAKADQAVAPVSAAPVSQTPAGLQYTEGKPSMAVKVGAQGTIFGLPKMVVIGGAAVLLLGGFLMLRKK